jgi:hypothetical protein
MSHKYAPRGILDLGTGDFTKTGINWSQVKTYGADIFISTGIIGTGVLVWKNQNE